jgi:hypothetical protein
MPMPRKLQGLLPILRSRPSHCTATPRAIRQLEGAKLVRLK